MIYFIQILKMLNKTQRGHLVALFDDLSMEIDDMGYHGHEAELINEMLDNHFGIFLEDDNQLNMLKDYILKHQNDLGKSVSILTQMYGM